MKVYFRVLLILAITVLIVTLSLNIFAHMFMISSSLRTETEQSDANILYIRDKIQNDADLLGTKARDWAVWDDTCDFMTGRNPKFYNSVIAPEITYQSLQITGILMYDNNGSLVAAQGYDPYRQNLTGIPDSTKTYFSKNLNLLSGSRGGKKRSGIVTLSGGPFLVGMHTILRTNGEGPGCGTLIMLQPFDKTRVEAIGDQLRLPLNVRRLGDPELSANPIVSRLSVPGAPPVQSIMRNRDVISGYTLLQDINGQPAMLVEVETPRTMTDQAYSSVILLITGFLSAGIIYLMVSSLVLHRYVISPLNTLSSEVKQAAERRQYDPLEETGDDEIAVLTQSVNSLIRTLAEKNSALAEAGRRSDIHPDLIFLMLARDIRDAARSLTACADCARTTGLEHDKKTRDQIADILSRQNLIYENLNALARLYRKRPGLVSVHLDELLEKEIRENPEEQIRWEDDCAVSVLGDELLGTALHNILLYRTLTAAPGTMITVSARDNRNGSVEITVIDNGKGISDLGKASIFEGNTTDAERNVQNATGLYIAKLILESYGGSLLAEDRIPGQPSRGSVIRFTLKKA